MPDFVGLTRYVIDCFAPPADSEIMVAFWPWHPDNPHRNDQSAAKVPLDQIFNLLHLEYGKDEVNALVTEKLSTPLETQDVGREHGLIKRISKSTSGVPQIVTTNFDRLFEIGPEGEHLRPHEPPAFPDLNFGSKIEGITYLHGRLVEVTSESHPYVLSSADFGRAYLSEGWATNFIRHLLERYTVVLVGYQAEDPPIKYLLQGLNHDGQYDRSRLYAFDRGLPEEIEARWRDRGVTAIAYSDHPDLWKSMEAWADRADDLRKWRASIINKAQHDPKNLAPHERGQVAHVLRTVQGARLFSEADPLPHPEWVCVMDANVRLAAPGPGDSAVAEVFDARVAYGLDDDLTDNSDDESRQGASNDNLLVWRHGDDSPHEFHRLAGRQVEGYEAIPRRLGYLIKWISKSIDSPVLAWWAIRKNGLHPRLLHEIELQLAREGGLHERARHIWNLILEYFRDPRNRQRCDGWFDLKTRINLEGWTASVLREFQRVAMPRLDITPPHGLSQSRPPCVPWEQICLEHLGHFEVKFLYQCKEDVDVPDDFLPQVFGILEDQLIVASGLLGDIDSTNVEAPTCYADREIDGDDYVTPAGEVFARFVHLFDRMADRWPALANAHATTWPVTDRLFFRKLKLYAFNKVGVFEADYVAEEVLSLDQETFWDIDVARELLFLFVDRWGEFSLECRNRLIDRILTGPNKGSDGLGEECAVSWDEFDAARYARYIELQGCELAADHSERLAEMIQRIPRWSDRCATSLVDERGHCVVGIVKDEKPDVLVGIPVNEVVSRAKEDLNRDVGSFIEKRPFTGMVRENPRKALSALTIAGKAGDYPEVLWLAMINEIPANITSRLRRVFLNRLARLPNNVIVELRHNLARWLRQNLGSILEFDVDLGWAVYDHVVEGILGGGADATKSDLVEIYHAGGVAQRSRRTLKQAFHGPIGLCAEALFSAVPGEIQAAGSLIPYDIKSRVERLFTAPGEGADHAVSVTTSKLVWLMSVDPAWTKVRIIPMLAFEHSASEPAWNGFLHGGRVPSPPLAEIIKPLLLDILPWIEEFSWDRNLSNVAVQWLGIMRVRRLDELGGLSEGQMRAVIRTMTDATRKQFIFWLGLVGQQNDNGWVKYVIPLINESWPRERRYRTSASMTAWMQLLVKTQDSFPVVYNAVKQFLVPTKTADHSFYLFTRVNQEEKSIAALYPEETLDLVSRTIPQAFDYPLFGLKELLELIGDASPILKADPRYVRLIDLIECS